MSKVVARVVDKEITEEDVLRFMEEIGPQVAMQFQSADGIKTIIQEMINQELLLLDAKDSNFEEEEEFKTVMAQTKDSLLKNYAFTKVIKDASVTDEEAKKFFEDNKSSFAKESVVASHILVDSEEKAKEIKKEVEEGKAFDEAAKEYSTCPSSENGGSLGEFSRGSMVKEFEDVAFTMGKGEISEPVKTQFGYHLIKVDDKKDPDSLTFEDVETDVRSEALRLKQQKIYLDKLQSLSNKYETEILDTNI